MRSSLQKLSAAQLFLMSLPVLFVAHQAFASLAPVALRLLLPCTVRAILGIY